MFNGQNPGTGSALRRAPGDREVSAFDLTFLAPKSVSILFGIGDDDLAQAVRAAHDEAVADALGYLERNACFTRRGHAGRQRVHGNGFVAAAFRHRTSRAGDPQLHTHVVVGNFTCGPDDRWTTLDSRALYRHAKTAGYLYQAALRAQLTDRLGLQWGTVSKGAADLDGVPRALIEHFSQRRAEIVKHMRSRGEWTLRARQVASLATRRRKDYGVPADRLREEWQARAAEHGFGRDEVANLLNRTERFPADRLALARRAADLGGPAGVTRDASTFDRRDVVQAWAERHREGQRATDIEALADGWLGSGAAIRIDPRTWSTDGPTYSTPELLDIKRRILAAATARAGLAVAVGTAELTERVLGSRSRLSSEQANVVRRLVSDGHGVEVVRSAAGTGKTYALDAAREVWEAAGFSLCGCALSARAAAELQDQAGVRSTTIAQLQGGLDRGYGLDAKSVLVVDEAGMVGSRAMAQLLEHADATGAKVVLVGDDRQLPELQAGGAFRALAGRLGAQELREARRQHEQWDRDALNALRAGDVP